MIVPLEFLTMVRSPIQGGPARMERVVAAAALLAGLVCWRLLAPASRERIPLRTPTAVSPSAPEKGHPWAMYRGNPLHTAWSPAPEAQGKVRWKVEIGGEGCSPVSISADGKLYFLISKLDSRPQEFTLKCLDAATGKQEWARTTGRGSSYFQNAPGLGPFGMVYAAWEDGVTAFDAKSGEPRWTNRVGSAGPVTVGLDGAVYGATTKGRVFALNGHSGKTLWDVSVTNAPVHTAPALGPDGHLYVGANDGCEYALDSRKGAVLWTFRASGLILSSAAIGRNGLVYFGSCRCGVYAVDARDGSQRWVLKTDTLVWSSPAIGRDGTVYVGDWRHRLHALDAATGKQRWQRQTGSSFYSPTIASDQVYMTLSDQTFGALSASSGKVRWTVSAGHTESPDPAIGPDGTVYVSTSDGEMMAID